MLKIVSPSAELAVLRGMCHKDKKIAGSLLGNTDSSYFYSEESVEVFNAIKRHIQESGESPTYRLLIEDPDLSEEARSHLRSSVATVQTTSDAQKAARILDKYRKRRGLYNLAAHINSKMQGSRLDMDSLLEETSDAFSAIRSRKTDTNAFLHFGSNNNADSTIRSLLYDDNTENVIPTGIKAFDTVSGGFARGSLVTVGASSGGGKSLFANAIAIKMASMGYKVLLVPLEMSKREMAGRTLANVSKMNLSKILLNRLATGEKELAYKRYARWKKRVKEAGGRYTIFKPQEDMTMEDIIAATNSYAADIRIIDYISLLKGMDGDDMWRAMGAVARFAKINAEVEGCVNILLVQVNEEGKVRYSRAVTEHSSNSFIWTTSKEVKELGLVKIEQPKSRNSLSFPFTVKMDWEHMRIEDVALEDSGMGTIREEQTEKKKRRDVINLATSSDI